MRLYLNPLVSTKVIYITYKLYIYIYTYTCVLYIIYTYTNSWLISFLLLLITYLVRTKTFKKISSFINSVT